MDYDFGGWATRNDVKCADGRIIKQDAFAADDGKKVPLVWMHQHDSVSNVLGHAILENRAEGVYAYGTFNNTPEGINAKEMVRNGDIDQLSIYANKLQQHGHEVKHGVIREVSLVLAGANPEAFIDSIAHSDDDDAPFEGTIYSGEKLELAHAENRSTEQNDKRYEDENGEGSKEPSEKKEPDMPQNNSADDKTVQDVIDSMSEEQKNVLYYLVGMAADQESGSDEEDENMKHNIFEEDDADNSFAHGIDFEVIKKDAKRLGSMRDAFLEHGIDDVAMDDFIQHADYGIEHIDYLFPDYKNVTNVPGFVSRDMSWVAKVMNGVSHTPFARIKSTFANITEDDARAKGYIKGNQKKNEVFTLLKRTTDPQTIYKKQKLDRDDMIDITDFDVVAWLKGEMRMMLDEEIARAILVGDGRLSSSEDKISEDHVRPIWKDDDFYTIKAQIEVDSDTATEDSVAKAMIRAAIKARKDYKGSGNPTFFTTEDNLTTMLLLTDEMGRDLYESPEQLAKKLRVKEIVTVEVMENQTREETKDNVTTKYTLEGLVVNLADYNVGADKGGAVGMFDDFDIDYNQMKYLIETRCSGALIKPYSAIAVETYPKA